MAPGVDSASKRNEDHEYFLRGKGGQCVGLTSLPLSCADSLEIWEPQILRILRVRTGIAFRFYFFYVLLPERLFVLYTSHNAQRLFPYTLFTFWFFVTPKLCVYCAVTAGYLNTIQVKFYL